MSNHFILHGHFYQPPRENPWTGYIDRQPSAYPYNDWNTRIHTECYAACSRTPIFDHGNIQMIINCYEYLSFNFGPTLLEWMSYRDNDPRTVDKIIEADKISVIRNGGHGNAIAQVYNHIIMPLANEKDQYTQIIWGLQDFKIRFGRDSEGMWLGETAINNETAAILVDCGIKFVILSPYQARRVIHNSQQIDVIGGNVDTSHPYFIQTKNGPLSIFFYDGKLASGVSFGDLLVNSNNLYNAINNQFFLQNQDVKLVHTATDGEVYGHHKSYGNMALARMIYDISYAKNPEFVFTNYGKFLHDFPAKSECELHLGDDGLGSSWSCAHGVGRWMRDCGCHTGGEFGWDQKWRKPLRDTFDLLRDSIHTAAEENTKGLLKNVWDARNDYFFLLSHNADDIYESFFSKHQVVELTNQERIKIIKIMESLRYAMLMYTSCGWFFSDLSGIETVQDILYGIRAYEFAKDFLDPNLSLNLKSILSQAKSNVVSEGTGTQILDASVKKYHITLDMLKEYMFWLVSTQGLDAVIQGLQEFSIESIWTSKDKKKHVVYFNNYMGLNSHAAFFSHVSDDNNSCLLWKEIVFLSKDDFEKENFWRVDDSWNCSHMSSMRSVLKIRFLSRNIQHEMEKGYTYGTINDAFTLDAIWGLESLLLPYEKRILVFHFASSIHQFSKKLSCATDCMDPLDTLVKESALLKKTASSEEEAILYLEPIVRALKIYIENALDKKDVLMIKEAQTVFWIVKDCISMSNLDLLRDLIFSFYKVNAESLKGTDFIKQVMMIMKEMKFSNI